MHWAAKGGHSKIAEMLINRGARVHTTNMGDDTPLHLAAAHGNRDIVNLVRRVIVSGGSGLLFSPGPSFLLFLS